MAAAGVSSTEFITNLIEAGKLALSVLTAVIVGAWTFNQWLEQRREDARTLQTRHEAELRQAQERLEQDRRAEEAPRTDRAAEIEACV